MPNHNTTTDYLMSIRLDMVNEEIDAQKLLQLLRPFEKFVVYREIADVTRKSHLQGYVVCGNLVSQEKAKKEFADAFRATHTRYQRSFAEVRKPLSYMRYVAKDKNLAFSQGVPSDEIIRLEQESYKKTGGNITERCYNATRSSLNTNPERAVSEWLIQDCIDRKARIDMKHLRCVKATVMSMHDGSYRSRLIDELESNLA